MLISKSYIVGNITITRDGNRLKKVTDQCEELTYAGAMNFKDGANEQVEYTWDTNGNMTSDLNNDGDITSADITVIYNLLLGDQ